MRCHRVHFGQDITLIGCRSLRQQMTNAKLPQVPQRTTPGFAFPAIDRALKACLAARQFGQKEIAEVLAFFGTAVPECVFCGSPDVKRWDHLVSVNRGGETVLGNMVPACARCDDSKRNVPFDEWMTSSAKGSPQSRGIADVPQRVERIREYVEHYNYEVRSMSERLSAQELERLEEIRSRLADLRRDVDALISDYRERTGNK